jgi:hypothetical protein
MMRRKYPWFLPFLLALGTAAPAADVRVDLKSEAAMAVSVPLGTDNGVTRESDFSVLLPGGAAVHLYPFELYRNMFWSQPLPAGTFSRIAEGNPVVPARLGKEDHEELRKKGEKRKAELVAAQEEARREAARKEAAALQQQLERLEAHRDDLSRRITPAEQAFLAEESKYYAAWNAFDAGTDQSLQNIMEYLTQRDEVLERRNALSARRPSSSTEVGRLDAQIRRLDSQIAAERDNIRIARDGRRAARSSFLARRQAWEQLAAERKQVAGEIRSVEQRIREISKPR